MNLANVAIALLWLLIGAIILAGVIWLVIYGIEQFVRPIPDKVKQGIWFIALILVLIGAIMTLTGNPPFRLGAFRAGSTPVSSTAFATLPAPPAGHLQSMLSVFNGLLL